jgi:hypothetical protein
MNVWTPAAIANLIRSKATFMRHFGILSVTAAVCVAGFCSRAAEEPPREWIEPTTGHRVIRLSTEPGTSVSIAPRGNKIALCAFQAWAGAECRSSNRGDHGERVTECSTHSSFSL